MAYQFKQLKLMHRNSWVYETDIVEDAKLCITKRIGTQETVLYARLAELGKKRWKISQLVEAGSSKPESYRLYLLQRQT